MPQKHNGKDIQIKFTSKFRTSGNKCTKFSDSGNIKINYSYHYMTGNIISQLNTAETTFLQ